MKLIINIPKYRNEVKYRAYLPDMVEMGLFEKQLCELFICTICRFFRHHSTAIKQSILSIDSYILNYKFDFQIDIKWINYDECQYCLFFED